MTASFKVAEQLSELKVHTSDYIELPFIFRASDISRKKMQNFAGFSRGNSRKNRLISRDCRGKKVKIRGEIGRFCGIFAGEKSKFAGKSAHFEGF